MKEKCDKSFTDCITQVEKISQLTQHPELQLAWAKPEGIVYKLIELMPLLSTWATVKKIPGQVFSPVATKMHSTARIYIPSS